MKEVAVILRALRGYVIDVAEKSTVGEFGSGDSARACLVKAPADSKDKQPTT